MCCILIWIVVTKVKIGFTALAVKDIQNEILARRQYLYRQVCQLQEDVSIGIQLGAVVEPLARLYSILRTIQGSNFGRQQVYHCAHRQEEDGHTHIRFHKM